jgi:hypothetical protein
MQAKLKESRYQVDLAYQGKKRKILDYNGYEKNMDNRRRVDKIVTK